MAKRKIIRIDEEKCNGCGQCVEACAEGAIQIVDGKARLVSEVYCDGLGNCIGECPQDAIRIEEREAKPFNEAATHEHLQRLAQKEKTMPCGCPSAMSREIERPAAKTEAQPGTLHSELRNWPVQLKLVPPDAPYFENADLLLVADCAPFALADFHPRFLCGKPVVVGCPKLDDADYYVEKLRDILECSSIASLTVIHMEVPCCSALTRIAEAAVEASGKAIPLHDVTVGIQGDVLCEDRAGERVVGKEV